MTGDVLVRRVSFVLLGACLLVLAVTLAGIGRASSDRNGLTGYRTGEVVDVARDGNGGADRPSLLVFLRSDCAASQMLVASLSELKAALPGGVEMLAVVSREGADREVAFAEAAGFARAAVVTADFRALRLRVVPSLVLVDGAGVVRFERLGAGSGWSDALAGLPRAANGL